MSQPEINDEILISVVIVNYKVPECLRETIRSVQQAELFDRTEIIVVDNASGDGSQKIITAEYPDVIWIQLKDNLGFGKACNVGALRAKGKYILLLNPDTVIASNTLSVAVDFMTQYPQAGIMGPKVLNPDGTLQASCRRSFVTPLVAFYYFSGLSRLFPKSNRFGKYHVTYMDVNQSSVVDAISGSFMFIRHSLYDELGGFDEQFFMYGEDLDLCWRAREKGYTVWYNPDTQIIHRKGQSSAKSFLRSRIAFYEAMVIFSKKYRHVHGGFLPGWLVYFGIMVLSVFNIGFSFLGSLFPVMTDLAIINVVLWGMMVLKFQADNPYTQGTFISLLFIHGVISVSFISMLVYNGIYVKKRYSVSNVLYSSLLASILFFATVYFVKAVAFSRLVFAASSVIISLLLVCWREIIPNAVRHLKMRIFVRDRIIIIGDGYVPVLSHIMKSVEDQKSGRILGILWSGSTENPGEFLGYPVLGTIDDLKTVLKRYKVDMLFIVTQYPWYSKIIELLSTEKMHHLTIRWVSHDIFEKKGEPLPKEIVLHDLTV